MQERAELASAARHALRRYARERCHLPGRLLARLYDGIRHLYDFGKWSSTGMTWEEVKEKYRRQAIKELGADASVDDIEYFIHKRVVDKACSTNQFFDRIALIHNDNNNNISKSKKLSSKLFRSKYYHSNVNNARIITSSSHNQVLSMKDTIHSNNNNCYIVAPNPFEDMKSNNNNNNYSELRNIDNNLLSINKIRYDGATITPIRTLLSKLQYSSSFEINPVSVIGASIAVLITTT